MSVSCSSARDDASPLSRLPPELVVAIARRLLTRPVCYGTRWLDRMRDAARESPDGAVHMLTQTATTTVGQRRGYVLEYRAVQRHERNAMTVIISGEQFTVWQWESDHDHGARTIASGTKEERWTTAGFLAKASYDTHWHLWFRGVHVLAFIPGMAQLQD